MEEKRFWDVVGTSRSKALEQGNGSVDAGAQMNELGELLSKLPPEDVVAFARRFSDFFWQAYRWDLWAVVYWLHGGCGDDSFMDARSCLIMLGRPLFLQVLADPEYLADLHDRPDVPFLLCEGFQYVAPRVYQEKFGHPLPAGPRRGLLDPVGERFDHDDPEEMRRRFPRLLAKFPEMGD